MVYFVLGAWLVQAAVGVALFIRWLRTGRHGAPPVLSHVALSLGGLALWIAFLVTGAVAWAWTAFVLITVGNGIGDTMLRDRSRALVGRTTFWRDYGVAIRQTFAGRFPGPVTFHAVFAGVVYFSCLGVCIGASLA